MSDSGKKGSGPIGDSGAAVIQVTPGQIVGAAVFLLICAAVIFLAGMFARGLTMGEPEEPESETAQAETPEMENVAILPAPNLTPPDPIPEPEPEPRKETKPVERPPEPEPEPETTPAEMPAPETETVEDEAAVVRPKPATVVEAPPVEDEPEAEASAPEPEPAPIQPEPEPAKAEPEPAPAPPKQPKPQPLPEIPASTQGPYTVQVMYIGIAKRDEAEAFQRNALENKNVQVELVESLDGKGLRAYVGSYANRTDAEKARQELLRAGFDGCFVKKRDS